MQKRILFGLFMTLLIDMTSFAVVMPIIPLVLIDTSSPSFILGGMASSTRYWIAGLVPAVFGFMQLVCAPVLGRFSDAFGRKRLLIPGIAALALSQLLFGLGIEFASLSLIFASRILGGLAAANYSIVHAAIADVTSREERARNFGSIGAAFGLGLILGPFLSASLAHLFASAAAPFWFAAGLGFVNVLLVQILVPETHFNTAEISKLSFLSGFDDLLTAYSYKKTRALYFANFLYLSGFAVFVSFSGIYLVEKLNVVDTSIGTYFSIVGIWIVLTQAVILPLVTQHLSEHVILLLSLPLTCLGLGLFLAAPSMLFIHFCIPAIAIGNGLTTANINALVSASVKPTQQGTALGVIGSLSALSNSFAPVIAGITSGLVGIAAPFYLSMVLVVGAWSVLFRFRARLG